MPKAGAKASALSGAFCGIADDVTAIYYNPAGLGQLEEHQVFLSIISLYHNLDDSIYNGSLNGALYTPHAGVLALGWHGLFTGLYQENVFDLSYGLRVAEFSHHTFYAGMNIKVLYKRYTENGYTQFDPVFSDSLSKTGFSVDMGLLYRFHRSVNFGFSLFNLNQPDMGLNETSKVPLVCNIGSAFDLSYLRILNNIGWLDRLNVILGVEIREKEYRISPALELLFLEKLSVLGGMSLGERDFKQVSFGLGFIKKLDKKMSIAINYSFVYYLNGAHQYTYGNHYIELGFKF
ncbi:MAG: hypothetical protein KKH98_07925 [Spirochaetes bacterium]|nr:hypothetical protein [Spirochaetota bacterium]